MTKEKEMKPASGYTMVFILLALIIGGIASIVLFKSLWVIIAFVLASDFSLFIRTVPE